MAILFVANATMSERFAFAVGGDAIVVDSMPALLRAVEEHPRELLVTHYMVPFLLDAGYAVWVQGPRTIGNDLRLEHELAVFDVAAGMRALRDQGTLPPGIEDASVYRAARSGYFVSDDQGPWRDVYERRLAKAKHPARVPLRAAE